MRAFNYLKVNDSGRLERSVVVELVVCVEVNEYLNDCGWGVVDVWKRGVACLVWRGGYGVEWNDSFDETNVWCWFKGGRKLCRRALNIVKMELCTER